jgi:hypothetical protein
MEKAFVELKENFNPARIVSQYHTDCRCIIKTDFFDFVLGGVIFQIDSLDKLDPIDDHLDKLHLPTSTTKSMIKKY